MQREHGWARATLACLAALLAAAPLARGEDEILLGVSLFAQKGDLVLSRRLDNVQVDMAGQVLTHGVQAVATNSTALTLLAGHVTPGWCLILNLNATNAIVGGYDADVPFMMLKGQEFALFRLATNAIALKALVAPANVEYWVLED
jgi:hypothetical protein